MTARRVYIVQGLTVVTILGFLGVLACSLGQPGYTVTRLAFFAILGGLAVLGAAGVVSRRILPTAVGACGLLLLGLWQAVLWMVIFPVVGILLVATVVIAAQEPTEGPTGG
ncbi:hypothetical protein [Haloarchaeobius litoreus]|uniref:Uncharacterized protein n=1 Tax=Haloarchaeobius litoreus TaxID=755306 RepID=A0ABD6DE48_9EURY|nr:hypothetical protein [Haloarchaeobius litoreus]